MRGAVVPFVRVVALLAVLVILGVAIQARQVESRATGGEVTFHKDVEPLLQQHCQSCHRPGQIGPMPLLDYRTTRPWARAIRDRVVRREMPPWFADPSVGHFSNDRSMKPHEVDTIVKWVDAGAPQGDPKDAPPPVQWPADGFIIPPDHVVKGAEYTVPATGILDWIYFRVPGGFTEDTWVTSMELRAGLTPKLTHHYCMYVVPHDASISYGGPYSTAAAAGAGNSPFEGCFEPGQQPFDYRPQDAGRLIPANSDIVFQMHYNSIGREVVDYPQIGFTVTKERPRRQYTFVRLGAGQGIKIAPHQSDYEAPMQEATLNVDADIVWMQGHAHYRAKEMTFSFEFPDGKQETALRLKWHPFWQLLYYPTQAINAPKGTLLRVSGRYDNSSANPFNPDPNAPVVQGDQGADEMLFPTYGIIVDGALDLKQVRVVQPSPRANRFYEVAPVSAQADAR